MKFILKVSAFLCIFSVMSVPAYAFDLQFLYTASRRNVTTTLDSRDNTRIQTLTDLSGNKNTMIGGLPNGNDARLCPPAILSEDGRGPCIESEKGSRRLCTASPTIMSHNGSSWWSDKVYCNAFQPKVPTLSNGSVPLVFMVAGLNTRPDGNRILAYGRHDSRNLEIRLDSRHNTFRVNGNMIAPSGSIPYGDKYIAILSVTPNTGAVDLYVGQPGEECRKVSYEENIPPTGRMIDRFGAINGDDSSAFDDYVVAIGAAKGYLNSRKIGAICRYFGGHL